MDSDWTPKAAEEAAEAEGIALSEKHWRVIAGSRELIASHGRTPSLAEVSETCGVALRELKRLFPGGTEHVLAHIAGVPELERRELS